MDAYTYELDHMDEEETLRLNDDEVELIRLFLAFHQDDEPDEFYSFQTYHDLCVKFEIIPAIPPVASEKDWD